MIDSLKELFRYIKDYAFYAKRAISLRLAIRLADVKQKAFNRRYFVMLMATPKGDKLVSINNKEFDNLRRKDWLPKGMSTLDLEREAFYQTSLNLNGKTSKEERKAAMRRYMHYVRKGRMAV